MLIFAVGNLRLSVSRKSATFSPHLFLVLDAAAKVQNRRYLDQEFSERIGVLIVGRKTRISLDDLAHAQNDAFRDSHASVQFVEIPDRATTELRHRQFSTTSHDHL